MAIEKLGKYRIERELGRGGMGVVYLGRNISQIGPISPMLVAIKVLPPQLAGDSDFVHRFRREVATLQQLTHEGIVHILDHGCEDDNHYYVMEYLDGGSLESRLKAGRLDPLAATRAVLGVSRVLEHLHSQGVIHRDLKPANILLTRDGEPRLTDFGIAQVVDATRMTATLGVLGTVEYMSPEQSQGRFVDPRADIYSLGVIYYRALTGRLPVTGKTATEVIMNLRTRQIERPTEWVPDLPGYVSDLVMGMLEKDAARRVPSAKALSRELQRVEGRLSNEQERRMKAEGEIESDEGRRRTDKEKMPSSFDGDLVADSAEPFRWGRLLAAGAVLAALLVLLYLVQRPPSPEKRLRRANDLIAAGGRENDSSAAKELNALISEHPQSPQAAEAHALFVRIEDNEKKRQPGNLNRLAAEFARKKKLELARDIYKLVVTHYPDTSEAAFAAGRIAEIEHRLAHPTNNESAPALSGVEGPSIR